MSDFEAEDRARRQVIVEILIETVRYVAQVATPILLILILLKMR